MSGLNKQAPSAIGRYDMATTRDSQHLEPRISSLETAVASLTSDVKTIAVAVDGLRAMMADNQKPQWGNLIAAVGVGIMIISSIGASFIGPLNTQVGYHDRILKTQADVDEDVLHRLRDTEAMLLVHGKVQEKEIGQIRKELEGLQTTQQRLAVLEERLNKK